MSLYSVTNVTILRKDITMIKTYKKNDIIANEGDLCSYIGYIQEGRIMISTLTSTSEEYIISLKSIGESFGELLALSSHPYYPGTITALEDTVISFTPTLDYINTQLATQKLDFLKSLADEGIMFQNRVKILSQTSLKERLLFFITQETKRNKTKILYVDSKEHLAKLLAMPRPSLSRLLSTLKKEHIIDYDKHSIILL